MTTKVKNWTEWLKQTRFSHLDEIQKEQTVNWLYKVRDKILNKSEIKPENTVIDIGSGTGLLAFEACKFLNEKGTIIISDIAQDCLNECEKLAKMFEIKTNIQYLKSKIEKLELDNDSIDVAIMRSVLVHVLDKQQSLNEIYRILKPNGKLSFYEPIITSNTRYHELINSTNIKNFEKFKNIENQIMTNQNDPIVNFDENILLSQMKNAGFKDIAVEKDYELSTYTVAPNAVNAWFEAQPSPGTASMKEKFMQYADLDEVNNYIEVVKTQLEGKEISVKTSSVYISANK